MRVKMGKDGESAAHDAARTAFQESLRQALDTFHPRWELGLKGKEKRTIYQKFETVARETLQDWVNGGKRQRPQQKSFQEFLDEAAFPEETLNNIWALYLAFKRERRKGNHPGTPPLMPPLEQSSTLEASVPT